MTSAEIYPQINKFLYHLSNSDYSNAAKSLQPMVKEKVNQIFDNEYQKIKEQKAKH